jgi:hypothetical protein
VPTAATRAAVVIAVKLAVSEVQETTLERMIEIRQP